MMPLLLCEMLMDGGGRRGDGDGVGMRDGMEESRHEGEMVRYIKWSARLLRLLNFFPSSPPRGLVGLTLGWLNSREYVRWSASIVVFVSFSTSQLGCNITTSVCLLVVHT